MNVLEIIEHISNIAEYLEVPRMFQNMFEYLEDSRTGFILCLNISKMLENVSDFFEYVREYVRMLMS